MENVQAEKKQKANSKSSSYGTLRVKRLTRKRIAEDLAKANRKDFGRRVKADEYILLAVSRITPEDIINLQNASMSHADRLERDYRAYIAKNGPMSKDEYLGKRLGGELIPQDVSGITDGDQR
jgi:hypothetical protein